MDSSERMLGLQVALKCADLVSASNLPFNDLNVVRAHIGSAYTWSCCLWRHQPGSTALTAAPAPEDHHDITLCHTVSQGHLCEELEIHKRWVLCLEVRRQGTRGLGWAHACILVSKGKERRE